MKKYNKCLIAILFFVFVLFFDSAFPSFASGVVSSDPSSVTYSGKTTNIKRIWVNRAVGVVDLPENLVSAHDYLLQVDLSLSAVCSIDFASDNHSHYGYWYLCASRSIPSDDTGLLDNLVSVIDSKQVIEGSSYVFLSEYDPSLIYYLSYVHFCSSNNNSEQSYTWTLNLNLFDINNFIDLASSSDVSSSYQAGYDAGKNDGLEDGYSCGYSDGFSDGSDSGYDSGFSAGADSVDTGSYYDAGYSSGYNAGKLDGYETGYDAGYDAAMNRVAQWGADINDYPDLLISKLLDFDFRILITKTDTRLFTDKRLIFCSFSDLNPNHTYMIKVANPHNLVERSSSSLGYYNASYFSLLIGSSSFTFNALDEDSYSVVFFVPGDMMASMFEVLWAPYINYSGDGTGELTCDMSFHLYVYDYGPSGDTQNHIANQTDQLTNGYDSSAGTAANDSLSDSFSDYSDLEGNLFGSAKSGLSSFTLYCLSG